MQQTKKTYIPSITYNYRVLLIIVLALTSCNAQKNTTTKTEAAKQIAVDSVAYEIIKDSVYCEYRNFYHHLNILEIIHPDRKINNKLNLRILGYTPSDSVFFEDKIKEIKDTLKFNCSNSYDIYGNVYEVKFNQKGIFSVLKTHTAYMSIVDQYNYINIDINSAKEIEIEDIFSSNTPKLIKKINDKIMFSINEQEQLIEEDYTGDDKESFLSELNTFLEEDEDEYIFEKLPDNFIITKKGLEYGIEFKAEITIFSFAARALNPYPQLFFTFEELEPYLTNMFKERMEISM